jgi:hypothetical protein
VEDRPESASGLATRSEGDVSLGTKTAGGAADGAAPPNEGLAVSSAREGGGATAGGADRTGGGADWALAGSDDTTSAAPRMISQSFTAQSPALECWTAILGNRR